MFSITSFSTNLPTSFNLQESLRFMKRVDETVELFARSMELANIFPSPAFSLHLHFPLAWKIPKAS
jgi:hypothetical protein